jgi:hypothetical protein
MATISDPTATREHAPSLGSHDEERALVQRVLATPSFARSAFLTNFLTYVCDRKLRGREDEITEYQIGIQAFGRPAGFHTGEDNIVRNYARILRRRLDEYFAAEGRDAHLRIVIPLGRYIPVFEPNTLAVPIVLPPEPELVASAPSPPLRRRPSLWWVIGAALIIASIGLFAARRLRSPDAYTLFWSELAPPDRTTFVIPADSGLAMLQDITGKEIHLHDYVAGNMNNQFSALDFTEPSRRGLYGANRFANYTSTAGLSIVVGLLRLPQFAASTVKVRYARDVRMEDLKRSNAVIIGGPRANPWDELFEPQSNFKMQFPIHLNGVHFDERSILNRHPRPGELPSYTNVPSDSSHHTYALVSFLPSLDGNGHVLLLEGQNMSGTLAAGDFVTDPSAMTPILEKARQADGTVGPFEVLLETRSVGENAPEAHVMIERHGRDQSN